MRFFIARLVIAVSAATLLAQSGYAQAPGGGAGGPGGGRKQHEQKTDKSAAQKPKADDKAYNAALKGLPNKPYDPWHNAR